MIAGNGDRKPASKESLSRYVAADQWKIKLLLEGRMDENTQEHHT